MGLFDSLKNVVAPGSGSIPGLGDLSNIIGGSSAMDLIPGIGDARAQERANKLNLNEAATNRAFQERMSNTAYQRSMQDMHKAGLNPILAYAQGGASTPSGSTATVESASKTRLADMALKATTGIGGLSQQSTALQQQQSMNESTKTLQATASAKNVADAERVRAETKGLGRKASEGALWDKFYKKINTVLDTSAKHAKQNREPLIKVLKSQPNDSKMFKFLNKGPK